MWGFDKEQKSDTVASVVQDFSIAIERLKVIEAETDDEIAALEAKLAVLRVENVEAKAVQQNFNGLLSRQSS